MDDIPESCDLMDTSLTIIIVNWNGGEMLQRCLASIRASRHSFLVKVIVADNDSGDGSREEAERGFPEFTVVNTGGNLGFGRANNFVRSMVETSLVLFLNPDTELKENTLERCVQCLVARPDVGALGCKMLYPSGEVQEQGLQWFPSPLTFLAEMLLVTTASRRWFHRWLPLFDPERSAYYSKLYGGFVLAPKHVLDSVGWFDDRYFMYAEDVDLSRSITDKGWKLYYCAEAEIIHVAGGTSAKAPSGFAILMKCDSLNKLMIKYHGALGGMLHRLIVLAGALLRLIVLLPVSIVARMGNGGEWGGAVLKQKLMILWALGLKKPFVASSR